MVSRAGCLQASHLDTALLCEVGERAYARAWLEHGDAAAYIRAWWPAW